MLREGTRLDCGERNFQRRHGLTWWKHGSGRSGWFRSSRDSPQKYTGTAMGIAVVLIVYAIALTLAALVGAILLGGLSILADEDIGITPKAGCSTHEI